LAAGRNFVAPSHISTIFPDFARTQRTGSPWLQTGAPRNQPPLTGVPTSLSTLRRGRGEDGDPLVEEIPPFATMTPVCREAATSTPASQNQARAVEATGMAMLAVKSPGAEI
jgi:hypothetical protein